MLDGDVKEKHHFKDIINHMNRDELNIECQRWALAHGFVQRYFVENDDSKIIPYPFTIYPSSYPRHEYEKAYKLQRTINIFVQRLAFDINLMDLIFQKFMIECDPFVRRLRDIYSYIQQLPYKSVAETCIIRTDYMLQKINSIIERTSLRLIEINTIAVGLGAAAKLIHVWHKDLLKRIQPDVVSQLPPNESYDLIIDTLFQSWKLYNKSQALILFIVPKEEFNIGDQMLIEQGISSRETPSPLIKHVTLLDVYQHCFIDSNGLLFFDEYEVGLVYYRTAYDPKHFYSEDIWQAYIMLESSQAVKCPSLRYHLAGMKCFQLACMNDVFLDQVFHKQEQHKFDLRDVTEEMFTIDQAINDPVLQQRIREKPDSFYLKQSREGGGNVYCGLLLKEHIDQIIADKQSNRYFLMSRIYAPVHQSLIRSSRTLNNDENILEKEIQNELGIFGSLISQNETVVCERIAGSLLRSKLATNTEGGIATGQGFIDSLYLV